MLKPRILAARRRFETVDPADPAYRRWLREQRPLLGASPIMSEAVVGWQKETSFGSFVAPTSSKVIACQPTIRGNTKNQRPDQARGTRSQVVDPITGYEVDVTLVGELVPVGWSSLCAGAFGSGSDQFTSAGGAATHAMTPQPQCPSYSLEVDYDVITGEAALARQIAGCVPDQIQLKATNQSIVQATAAFIGQRETTPSTPGAGTFTTTTPAYFNTIQPMDFSLAAYTYKGTSSTQLLDLTVALLNHTQRVFGSNGQLYATRLVPTKREVTLATLLDFLDTTYYSDWIAGTKTSGIVVTLTSATNIPGTAIPWSIAFTLPGIRPIGEYSLTAASDVIQQNIQWSVTLSGSNEISSTWVNNEAGSLA